MREGTPLEAAGEGFVLYGHYETCPMKDTSYGVMYMLTAGLIDRQEGCLLYTSERGGVDRQQGERARVCGPGRQAGASQQPLHRACHQLPLPVQGVR